jgi:hypothetical protein
MPQDPINAIDIFLYTLAAVFGGFAVAGAVQAWRSWSDHRRIEKHGSSLTSPDDIVAAQPTFQGRGGGVETQRSTPA